MDRLADISRPAPTNRIEANDFTRTHSSRSDRRDGVEAREEERVSERERPERGEEKKERFSLQLAEQKAAFDPAEGVAGAAETETAQEGTPETEKPAVEPQTRPGQPNSSAPKGTVAADDTQPAPLVQAEAPEIAAAAEAAVKPDAPKVAAPITPPVQAPVAVPVAPGAALPASTAEPAEIQPAIATTSRTDGEKPVREAEGSATKLGAPRADGSEGQVRDQSPARETPVETPKSEAPRETPAARSAQEVERAADILRQIRVQLTPGISEARIQLQPIELGRISIHLTLENGRMKTTVRAEKTETLQAIQTHLPELRAAMRQHGIDAQEFQLTLGFENRAPRDGDKPPARSNTREAVVDTTAIERSPALHAALAKTGVDFYA